MSTLINRSILLLTRCPTQFLQKVRYVNTSRILYAEIAQGNVPKKPKKSLISPITWRNLGVLTVVTSGLLAYMYYLKDKKDKMLESQRRREMGKAAIGGTFELVNSEGKLVTSESLLNQWVLLYFGFTHCPDVCPDELEKITEVVNTLEKSFNLKVQPVFISVDPDRDTPEVVGKYVKEFSDKFLGLTGSHEQVAKACKAYRVYYSNGPKDEDMDYIVDHTIIVYLIDPEGGFVDYFGQSHSAEQIINSVVVTKAKYDKRKSRLSFLPSLPTQNVL